MTESAPTPQAPAQEIAWQPTFNLRWCERSTGPQEQLRGAPPRITELQQLFVVAKPNPHIPNQMDVISQQWRPVTCVRETVAPPQISGPS